MEKYSTKQNNNTPIGIIRVAASEKGLVRVELCGTLAVTQSDESGINLVLARETASQSMEEIIEYLNGQRREFSVPIDWSGFPPFQQRVLEAAMCIPFGEYKTYGEIARELGNPNASRAVGTALGRNPMPLVIPCHRVVAANGHLTGFSAADGVKTKQWLLELEGHQIVAQKLV